MKILIICSGNNINFNFPIHHAFVYEQIEKIKKIYNIEYDTFFIKGKGVFGYLKNLPKLNKKIRKYKPDFVHAHFGLSGLLASLQRIVPTIITFHGSDANLPELKRLSRLASSLSQYDIFVSDKLKKRISSTTGYSIIPCGIDLDTFYPIDMSKAREELKLDSQKKYILFASGFDVNIKNAPLAFSAVEKLSEKCELIELKNRSRDEVNLLLNACNLLLLTSKSEGSPQVIKEAMACNCPIIATDVGDIKDVISGTDGCFITSSEPEDVAEKISLALEFGEKTNGREKIAHFDNNLVAKKVFDIYCDIANKDIKLFLNRKKVIKTNICILGIWDRSVPGIKFNKNGVSNYAKMHHRLSEDFPRGKTGEKKWKSLKNDVIKKGQGNRYDCIIGVSGGTDSSYLMHIAKSQGLRPLAVNLDNGWGSEKAVSNIKILTSALNIDLETYVIDYEEIKDLMRSFMIAGLPWIDAPTDLAIQSVLYQIAEKEKIKYIFVGNDFRSEGKQPTEWTYSDQRQLLYIHKLYGKIKLKTYPLISLSKLVYDGYLKKIKMIPVYNYIEYNKQEAQHFLKEKYGWEYYGEHHHENLFTKFAIGYWLFEKFRIDKRIITYSAQVLSGEITRDEALQRISEKPYNPDSIEYELDYVLNKLSFTRDEFENIWISPNKSFLDYPSNYFYFSKFHKYLWPLVAKIVPTKPKIFYEIEQRNDQGSG